VNIQCAACAKWFTSDNTPMAAQAVCMMCRPNVAITCDHCGTECRGAYDGQLWCRSCRAARYDKTYLYADTTGARLWRLTAGKNPNTPDW
jgi:hypothetical protein